MDWKRAIENLLRRAEDPVVSEGERTNIQEKVSYLMAKYGIEEFNLNPEQVKQAIHEVIDLSNPYRTHKQWLMNGISRALGCTTIVDLKKNNSKMYLFGMPNDVERTKMLYFSLLAQGFMGLADTPIPANEHGKSFRHSWLLGYVETVAYRVAKACAKAQQEIGPGTEIVLSNRQNLVAQEVNKIFPAISVTYKGTADNSNSGRLAGQQAGARADLGIKGMGGSRQKALSR